MMNFVSTVASVAQRNLCLPSRLLAPSIFTAIRKLSAVPSEQQTKEEEDVLYKRCEVECRSIDRAVLKSYSYFALTAARELGIKLGECITPNKAHHKRWTTLKSVFVHRKHLVQYEVRTYYTTMKFLHLTGSTADTYLEYIQRNLPEGVAMKVTRVKLERLPDHLKTPTDVEMVEEEKPQPNNEVN